MPHDHQTNIHERRVFRDACVAICERIGAEFPVDDGTALETLCEVFPDKRKKRDGRSWLPLHWASVLDTSEADFRAIIKDRPLVPTKHHLHEVPPPVVERDAIDYGEGNCSLYTLMNNYMIGCLNVYRIWIGWYWEESYD